MSQGQFSSLINFVSNNGKIIIFSREIGIRKSISAVVDELGLAKFMQTIPDSFESDKSRADFIRTNSKHKELCVILNFTSENSNVYFQLLSDMHACYGERLKAIAIVDRAYEGLISLLFARGVKSVLVKPFSPIDLRSRIMNMFAELSPLDRLIDYGRNSLASGDLDEALNVCEKINVGFEPTHQSLLFCGDVHLALKNFQKAGRFYILGFKDEQLSFQAYASLARLCKFAGRIRGEIYWLKKFSQINTLDYNNYINIGELYLVQGDKERAKSFFDRGILTARKLANEKLVSELVFSVANICATNKSLELGREYANLLLRDGNVDKNMLSRVAFLRMNKLRDLDGAGGVFHLIAVREERKLERMDLDFWSTAMYNAAICHHIAHRKERLVKSKMGAKRASDIIVDILERNPEFGKNDDQINTNIQAIASNPLQQNPALIIALRNSERR